MDIARMHSGVPPGQGGRNAAALCAALAHRAVAAWLLLAGALALVTLPLQGTEAEAACLLMAIACVHQALWARVARREARERRQLRQCVTIMRAILARLG